MFLVAKKISISGVAIQKCLLDRRQVQNADRIYLRDDFGLQIQDGSVHCQHDCRLEGGKADNDRSPLGQV